VTNLPDWLVERAALDEVGPASRDRLARADATDLASRIAAIREANAAELTAYPAAVAIRQLADRVRSESRRRANRRWRWIGMLSAATATLTIALFVLVPRDDGNSSSLVQPPPIPPLEPTRVKGIAHLTALRQAGDHVERLDEDALVHGGDVLQLRYSPSGQRFGLIASIDGAGVVTLHYPAAEDASPAATALAPKTTTLPSAYALDDAPRFERFFFITSADPIDVRHTLSDLRTFASRSDSDTAALDLPESQHQWSLRLRKPTPTP
jgi:hypothetical protein